MSLHSLTLMNYNEVLENLKRIEILKPLFESKKSFDIKKYYHKLIPIINDSNDLISSFTEVFLYTVSYSIYSQNVVNGLNIICLDTENDYIVIMERGDGTLFELLIQEKEMICKEELKSIIFQLFAAITSMNKCLNIIHNDLHLKNIIYFQTNKEFLHYKINNKIYKVPTFGKIFKIIDFGDSVCYYNNKYYAAHDYYYYYYYLITGNYSVTKKETDISDLVSVKNTCILLNIFQLEKEILFKIQCNKNIVTDETIVLEMSKQMKYSNHKHTLQYGYENISDLKLNEHYISSFLCSSDVNNIENLNDIDNLKMLF